MAAADSGRDQLPDPDTPGLIPDDASALEPDRLAWLAEQRRLRRRRWLRRLLLTRRWDRFGVSGPIVVLCLLATGVVGTLTVVLIPRPAVEPPQPAPLATVAAVGESGSIGPSASLPAAVETTGGVVLGRRLPPTTLAGDAGPVASETLRPAVLLLVPTGCGCVPLVREIYRQTREFRITLWLVAAGPAAVVRSGLIQLDEDAATGAARWAVDPDGLLAGRLSARGVTLAAVRADGVLTSLRREVPLDPADLPALEPVVAGLPRSTR